MEPTTRILIPTDFSIASLNLVKEAVDHSTSESLDIMLVYGVHLPTSISDLLFFSKAKQLEALQTHEFVSACSLLKNKYQSKIKSIYPELLTANNNGYIEQFLKHERIDLVYIPTYYKLLVSSRKHFDPTPMLAKVISTSASTKLNWPGSTNFPFSLTNHLSDLFLPS